MVGLGTRLVGDTVLVLLPTSTSKLLAKWQGPYQITKRMGLVNYQVDMLDRRKRFRIFHVNMLKEYHLRPPMHTNCFNDEEGTEEESEVPLWNDITKEEPKTGKHLTEAQQQELKVLLKKNSDLFSNSPGRTTLAEHHIETGDAYPVKLPPYRVPHAYRDSLEKELKEMEKAGLIESSTSDWASPIVLIKKEGKSMRMCVDYRRLNSVTKVEAYPMPRVDELIDRLGKAKYITTLDLTRGYWQVLVAAKDRYKTAFITPWGLYEFKVMPFGLSGAPASFQKLMDRILRGSQEYSEAYLDDVVIFSKTWEEHLKHLTDILERIRKAGLTVKLGKCQFAMSQCVYLGHVVGNGMVKLERSKVETIENFPVPENKREIRTFLGLTGYYRKFIPDYATIAAPLLDLTKKALPNSLKLNDEARKAFEKLKKLLCSEAVLSSPDLGRPFILQTDASDRGVGAVLCQQGDDGEEHPVYYYSRKFLPREERYSVIEKECLAIKLAVTAFRVYLLGRSFVIQTDHRSLEWLDRLKDNNPRLCRWSLALQPYQYTVVYRAGDHNKNADALSRAAR